MKIPGNQQTQYITQDSPLYPAGLSKCLQDAAPKKLWLRGRREILEKPRVALLISRRCTGRPIVAALDLARALRDAGVVVVGAFHSAVERDCFDFLIRGDQGVIWCPARTIDPYRIPPERREAVEDGRLLLLSPFDTTARRQTAGRAKKRNELVAAMSDMLIIPYADPGGNMEELARLALNWDKQVVTFDMEENKHLTEFGVKAMQVEAIVEEITEKENDIA